MKIFIDLCFLYIIGGTLGWLTELFFRRIVHKKWVNPGFLVGPNLPLYGIGVVLLYLICSLDYSFIASPVWRSVFIVAVITVTMTVIEYITGLIFIKGMRVKLWDYSSRWGNIQGIICPLFTLLWGLAGAGYYFFVHGWIVQAKDWIGVHPLYSFFIGIYFGLMLVDLFYSFHIVARIRTWAKESNVVVRYEELKLSVKKRAEALKEKYDFLLSLKRTELRQELEQYRKEREEKETSWKEKRQKTGKGE